MDTDLIVLIGCPAGLLLATVVICALISQRTKRLIAELRNDAAFRTSLAEGDENVPLVRATREHVVTSSTRGEDRIVLTRSLASIRREYAEDAVSHSARFSMGGVLTGVALLLTFGLIAWVMTHDISDSINLSSASSDESNSAMSHLAGAVRTLGGKFVISAAGIGGSVFAMIWSNRARSKIFEVADHPGAALLAAFTTIEEQQLKAKLHELELMRADRETRADQHQELCGHFERLRKIEVSVKDIGNEVSANLKKIMTEAMGDQLARILSDTMVEVDRIANRVEQQLTDSFGKQMQTLVSELQRGLETVRSAIDGQGQGQLDQILTRLQNTVSGGFQSESQKMVAALESFGKVVPALEQQLRAMAGQVAEETKQRNDDAARTTQSVLDRVTTLVETLSTQQAANAEAVERMQAASARSTEEMARRMETSGANLVSSVLGSSRGEIEAMVATMRGMVEANAKGFGDIEAKAVNASATVTQASEALAESARSVQSLGTYIGQMLAEAKRTGDSMQAAASQFSSAGSTLVAGVEAMRTVTDATRSQTQEQYALLQHQQRHMEQLEQLWPTLFETYLKKFRESSDVLANSWQDFHNKIQQATGTVGSDFAENTAMLSEAVDRLVKLNGARVAAK